MIFHFILLKYLSEKINKRFLVYRLYQVYNKKILIEILCPNKPQFNLNQYLFPNLFLWVIPSTQLKNNCVKLRNKLSKVICTKHMMKVVKLWIDKFAHPSPQLGRIHTANFPLKPQNSNSVILRISNSKKDFWC